MITFTVLDWIWITIFLLIMIGFGVLFYRMEKYYVTSRPIGFWNPVRQEAIKRGFLENKMP